tara:strand:+ start:2127 stop:2576 length:450 start_codon:yes stop_codon:yes gene_type:complete
MTEISFYHLQRQPLSRALPKLLEKVLQAGHRAVILTGSTERMQDLNAALWTYDPASFLPHGMQGGKRAEEHPIYLTTKEENPNGADILVLTDGTTVSDFSAYKRVLEMFDGTDEEMVVAARQRWKAYKAAGHALTYWQQTETGGWTKKA